MGDEKPKKPVKKPGASKLGGGILWALAQVGVEWFGFPESVGWGPVISAAAGAFIAGWVTTGLLNQSARWGAGGKVLLLFGAVLGVLIASGAVQGLSSALSWWRAGKIDIDWARFQDFILSWRVAPALALGALSGVYVRGKVPGKKK